MKSRPRLLKFVVGLASFGVAAHAGSMRMNAEQAAAQGAGGGPAGSLFTLVDRNGDDAVTRDELRSTFDEWYTRWDTAKSNALIGAFFKFHWNDGQSITVKIDEPNHPINAPFTGQEYVIVDETYTFSRNSYSRENLRVLTSIDYAKMSAEDKAKEQNPRPDGDYGLSWIHKEGKGRVFYEAHGHNEKVYANPLLLQHITAGMQYVLGDLPAEDAPSVRSTK